MYYEINVSKNGVHYFATASRSLITLDHATVVFWDIVDRFPVSDGFAVSMTYCETTGRVVTPKRRKKSSNG